MTADNVIDTIIVLAALGGIVWYVMPEMRANNIFNSDPRYSTARKPFPTTATLLLSCLVNVIGFCVFKSNHLLALVLFRLGFITLIAVTVGLFSRRSDFTLLRNFRYTLLVWLTVIAVAPILILLFYFPLDDLDLLFDRYVQLIYYGNGVGLITFGVLSLTSNHICTKSWPMQRMRFFVLKTTEAALALTFLVLILLTEYSKFWIITWLIYSILIALPIWFYKMDLSDYEDENPPIIAADEKDMS